MTDVNLLPEQKVSLIKEKRIRGLTIFVVGFFTLVWGLLLGGLFAYDLFLGREKETLVNRKELASGRFNELSSLAVSLATLRQKVVGINYLQKNRFDFPSSLRYVQRLFPAGVEVSKISIADSGEVVMVGKSTTPAVVASFISQIGSDSVLKYPVMTGFRYNDDGSFVFNVTAQYGAATKNSTNN